MDFKRSWNLLKIYDLMIIALLILAAWNIQKFGISVIAQIISLVLAAILFDFVISYVKEKRQADERAKRVIHNFSKSALITGLILGMIVEGSLLFLVMAAAIAILSKHIIRIKGRHVFNPANFALFVALFLPVSQSWWGTGNLVLVGLLGLVVVFKLKRFHLAVPFLVVHAAIMLVIFSFDTNQLLSHIASGAFVFFAFYMLVEPVTSPVSTKGRLVFGVLAGIFAALFYVVWLPAMLVGSLFFADLLVPFINRLSMPRARHPDSAVL